MKLVAADNNDPSITGTKSILVETQSSALIPAVTGKRNTTGLDAVV